MTEKRRYLSPREKGEVIFRQKNKCACGCGEAFDDVRSIDYDHALPISLGGSNDLENFRALFRKHHIQKTSREAFERAKADRIARRGGMTKKKPSAKDKVLAKITGIGITE